jgi:hypothetical protein
LRVGGPDELYGRPLHGSAFWLRASGRPGGLIGTTTATGDLIDRMLLPDISSLWLEGGNANLRISTSDERSSHEILRPLRRMSLKFGVAPRRSRTNSE